MQLDSNSLLFGALIIVVSFIINLIVVLIVKRSIRNDRMSKMITMQQAAFRTESAATLDRMRTSSKECQQNVDVSVSHAEDMVRQISDSLRTLSEYQEDLTALQSVCAEYKTALEKLRISTDQAEARISAVQAEVRKVEAVNDKMDSFRAEAERSMNQLQDLKAEYVRLVASTQESLRSASETQKSDNEAMLAAFSQQIERARELFGSFVAQERMDFKDFADGEMKKAEDQAIDTENRRDSILRSLEEGKAELDAFREDLSGAVSSLRDLRDGIRKECEESASAFRADTAQSREEAEKAVNEAIESARTALSEFSSALSEETEKQKNSLSDSADTLSGRISAMMEEERSKMDSFIRTRKDELSSDTEALVSRFGIEKEAAAAAADDAQKKRDEALENTNSVIAEALRSVENAKLALDGDRSSFIESSRDALVKSFSDMLEGVNQRYDRIKGEADAFIRAIADRVNDTRETITLLTQGEQERIQDSVERLQELERKIRASEEQLQKLGETVTSTREELFAAQQERGRLDSEIEERSKTLERLNDDMQKSKSARISEEAAIVRLKLQVSSLEKELEKEKNAQKKPETPPQKKPEDMISEFPDDIFTGNVEEVDLGDDD